MPQFGESITQSRIIHWLKKEGETVAEAEPLVEMETEKAVFSYESPFQGTLLKILEKEEKEVSVGTPIAHFNVSEEDGKKYLALGVGRSLERGETPEAVSTRGLAPLIRSLAKEQGIPLEEAEKINGTGPGGRITKEDFLQFAQKRGGDRPVPATGREGVCVIAVSPIRARIADNMTLSNQKIPHAGTSLDVDISGIAEWRSRQPNPPGFLSFIMSAAINALRENHTINSSWKESEGRRWIEEYGFIHLGIATATEQGLLVPVIHNAHTLSFGDLAREFERLVDGARKGNLKPQELSGGTFTVNNTGALGAVRSRQIIPHPQAAILAINRIVPRPCAVEGKVVIHPVLALDLEFDHRLIDGDQAVRFLVSVAKKLEGFDFGVIGGS